ncbi:hypothetical protein Xmau_04399 [Xenorhabdus mauleonii]|uniref:Transposase n=1 Tax=Xenorhabdus mauleonii TaxID=351675 RepID=A0A2G0NMR6_9GAMM|nr:hypothetical protein [Xenorhabdus mauleonii]PHM35998.1 hypothetical protein Xmau_04399 [Xenorhabdus mauleonii]
MADNLTVPVEFAGFGAGADRGRTARWHRCLRGYVGNGRPEQRYPRLVGAGRPKPTQHNVGELYARCRVASGVQLPNAQRLHAYNTHYVLRPRSLVRRARRTRLRLLLSASQPVLGNPSSPLAALLRPANIPEGRSACGLREFTSPAPTLLHWLRAARSRRLLARSRARHLRPVQPPQGASLEQNPLSCKNGVVSETSVIQSVAGRRLLALCRPHPQNGRPPPKQVGRRSPVAERENRYKIRLFNLSREKMAAILPLAFWQKNPESAYRRFWFVAWVK